jgi:L,D-transpeptidase ErfK/SrfK
MARLVALILTVFWVGQGGAWAAPAPEPPRLYELVAGGQEEVEVSRKTTLTRIALEKGVQWLVVARHNDIPKPYKVKPGMVLKINHTHIVPMDIPHGIVINLPELMLYHFHDGVYQRRYSLAVGKRSWPTPTGDWRIRNKTRSPTWTVPPSIQQEMANAGREVIISVPPGPQNPLGDYWLGTTAPGVGIHATNRPWSVGHSVSHGCIRMLPDEIAKLFPQIDVGTPVKIIYRPVKLAVTPEGRIFLEALPNIYGRKVNYLTYVAELALLHQLTGRIDWDKVLTVLKAREGIAQDITRDPTPPSATITTEAPKSSGPDPLSPLQGKEARLE